MGALFGGRAPGCQPAHAAGGKRSLDPSGRPGTGGTRDPHARGLAVRDRPPTPIRSPPSRTWAPPVLAEVVGFAGDRAFLMPASEVMGLAPGARVRPLPPVPPAAALGRRAPPHRAQRPAACCACRWAMAYWAGWWTPTAIRWTGRARCTACRCNRWSARPSTPCSAPPVRQPLDTRRARHQRAADSGPRPTARAVRGLGRGQERAAGHDGPLHTGRRDRGGPDR
jgi:hypothetical protein